MFKPSLVDLLKSSFRSILKNKGRTILTSLGIIIGVSSVVLLISIGNGLKNYITQEFESLGSNIIIVAPGKIFNESGGFSQSHFFATKFSPKDYSLLRRELKNVSILPETITTTEAKYRQTIKKDISLVGITANYGKIRNLNPSANNGRWFTPEEDNKKSTVVVLGYKIASDLFGNSPPLNRKILIGGKTFQVIGVVDKKGGGFGGPDLDSYLYTPLNTSFSFSGKEEIYGFDIQVQTKEDIAPTISKIKKVLLKHYDDEAFSVFDQSQILNSINSILNTLTIALAGIAAISLIVGGIGIMNIMLVSVTERTREIGLRKAIGAYPRAILLQFLFEAIILSVFGGSLGILVGVIGTMITNHFFPAKVTLDSILLSFGVSSLVGIVFGVAPARKASQLSPIDALRYE